MPTTFWKAEANDEIFLIINHAMLNWHKELNQHKIKIGVIYAFSDKPEKPAVSNSGYPAYATVRLVSPKDKVAKDYDVEMLVDATAWRAASSDLKKAIIDHELAHVVLKKKKIKKAKSTEINNAQAADPTQEEEVVLDDHGRAMVKLRKADWNVGDGFADVVARHGKNAAEYQNIATAEKLLSEAMAEVTIV